MNLGDVWRALSDACANIVGLTCTAYEPVEPTVPAAFPIVPEAGSYTAAFLGDHTVDFTVTVRLLIAQLDEYVATENLLPYLDPVGPQSVKAAIEDDVTLGGTVDSVTVTGWSGTGTITYGTIGYLGVDFTVDVVA